MARGRKASGLAFGIGPVRERPSTRGGERVALLENRYIQHGRQYPRGVPMRIAVCPGSFDPITNGHLDVIQRSARLFDRVVVGIAASEAKGPLFTLAERIELVRASVAHLPNVDADAFSGLLVDYVIGHGARVVVRGLRAVSDFEFEFQLALMNRKLNEEVETLFMMPRETYTFLSSRLVKEIATLGGDVTEFVPPPVLTALKNRLTSKPR